MTLFRLAFRSATHYWRTNLAVLLGVAAAVAVLGGALLVGDSVRGSLRDIALGRLGAADHALSSAQFFRDALAAEITGAGRTAAPMIVSSGFVTHEPSGRRAGSVVVYGVDERFWTFHGVEPPAGPAVSPALASELGAQAGDVLLVRLQRPSEIPIESLFGRKEEIGRTVRLTLSDVLPRDRMGEFALRPQQSELRAVFAPLRRVQRDLGVADRANTVLIAGGDDEAAAATARAALTVEDLGLNVRASGDGTQVLVDSASGILATPVEDGIRAAAGSLDLAPLPIFTYLANALRLGDREVPYSLVTATDLDAVKLGGGASDTSTAAPGGIDKGIVLNDWTARELNAKPGDTVELDYYRWDANAGLTTHTASFAVSGIVPIAGFAADRQLAPEYPGITGDESLADWDPPFPIDLSRVRDADERYWDDYRTTPKAFIPYARGRELWETRYGRATSLRFQVPPGGDASALASRLEQALRTSVRPEAVGVTVQPVRRLASEASVGATDFGQYFTYFSFFIVVSALLLAVLFFRLGVEQRLRQIGILRATGFTLATVRRLLLVEALALAAAGSAIGMAGAIAYGYLIMYGLRTWWIGAVGTSELALHVTPALPADRGVQRHRRGRRLRARVPAGRREAVAAHAARRAGHRPRTGTGDLRIATRNRRIGIVFAGLALVAIAAGLLTEGSQAGAFFGAGAASLLASMFLLSAWLRSRPSRIIAGRGTGALLRLGFRSAAFRPGRSVLSAALIASAAFIIVSVDAFRKGGGEIAGDRASGTGGYTLIATSELPLVHNPNEASGREALIVSAPEFERVRFTRLRVRPGDDASCLESVQADRADDRGAGAGASSTKDASAFASSLASTDEERANPWLLLRRPVNDGPVPVIADATSLQYVLHAAVGDVFSMDIGADRPLELQFVGAVSDSILQGELLMSEENFLRLFPAQQGYRYFLIDAPGVTTVHGSRCAVRRARAGIDDVRVRRGDGGRAARGVPPGREHLSLDVPVAGRPGPAPRHDRAGGGDVPQRPGTPARTGAAARRGLRPRPRLADDPGRGDPPARRRAGGGRAQRAARRGARVRHTWRGRPGRDARAAAGARGRRGDRERRHRHPCRAARPDAGRAEGRMKFEVNAMRTIAALFVLSSGVALLAQDQWRGPRRDGVIDTFKPPSAWPERPTQAWKVEAGAGHASPVVSGDRVFVFARVNDQETMTAYDLATGRQVWRQAYDAPYEMNPAARSHGKGPKSTPVIAGGRVFALGITGVLSAFDAAGGKVLWRHAFGKDFKTTSPDFGTAMSPIVDGGRVDRARGRRR